RPAPKPRMPGRLRPRPPMRSSRPGKVARPDERTQYPDPDPAAGRPGDVRAFLDRHHLPGLPADGRAVRRGQGGDPADHQRLPDLLRADERGAWSAVGRTGTAAGDPGRPGGVHPGLGRLRAVARPAHAAGVPRAAGAVGRGRPDRRPRGDPRRAAGRRRAAADEPGLGDLRHRPGDRADHRRLDAGCRALAADLLVPGRSRPDAAGEGGRRGRAAGAGLSVGRAVLRDMLQGGDAQRPMSQVSVIFGIAPAIAPIIGGWMLGAGRWPLIFWFLAAFGLMLLASVGRWLPETHPPELRLPLQPRRLLRDYAAIGANPRFQRLAAAGALNFAGMFLYIASAPAFLMDLLGLGEREFAWLFIPTIGGMTLGAFLSGRLAGRWPPGRQVGAGFACSATAAALNVAYNVLAPAIAVPWAVLPMSLFAFGVALVFPVL